jgi:hypothetical protein
MTNSINGRGIDNEADHPDKAEADELNRHRHPSLIFHVCQTLVTKWSTLLYHQPHLAGRLALVPSTLMPLPVK